MSTPVILDNDWSGDPDGLVALAHHLLHPGNDVLAVTSTFLHPMFDSPQSRAADGARLASELIALLGSPMPAVIPGAERPWASSPDSPAARAIVETIRRSGEEVVIACGGPLTNVAGVLTRAPDLVARIHLVWVGGSEDDAEGEYNRDTDREAAELVFGTSGLRITQFPVQAYRRNEVNRAWLQEALMSRGRVGAWLWQQFADLHLPEFLELGPTWVLGDSLPVLVTAMDEASCSFRSSVRSSAADVRVCSDYDAAMLVDDGMRRLAALAPA